MWAGQPGNDDLEAGRDRLTLQARERAMSCSAATAGEQRQPELLDWIDRAATIGAPCAPAHEIRIDRSDRVFVASDLRDRQGGRAAPILAALVASVGFALVGIPSGYFLFKAGTAPATRPVQSPDPAAGIANADKGDRLPIQDTTVRKIDRAAPAKSPESPRSSRAVAPPAAAASNRPTAAQPRTASPPVGAAKPHTEGPLTPVPETRPTTIEGWTLREVVDGTAVLEGPDGIFRVKRGDTVPGVGRVAAILRWGNRPIVVTSRGLISTP